MRRLHVAVERWPIASTFTIARGSKTEATVVVARLEQDGIVGHGECVPYARYGETVEGVVDSLERARSRIEAGMNRSGISTAVQPKAACNALDCALWDLEAKAAGKPVWQLAGLTQPVALETAYTISLDTPETMASAAVKAFGRNLLKLKLGQVGDRDRLRAIREAVPDRRLIVDANEGWSAQSVESMLQACAEANVELVEQPLPAEADECLAGFEHAVPICADESVHGIESLSVLAGKYDFVNIKLDKTGGLTEAFSLVNAARARGLKIMVGCMVGTSLAMAPAFLVAQQAEFVDLDGPLLLRRDRSPGFYYEAARMFPPPVALWG